VTRSVVLYDEDCGFCRWSVDVLLRLDRRRALRPVPIRSAEGDEMLSSIPPELRLASWHLRAPSGEVRSAGRAVPVLLRLLPGGRPFAVVAETFPRVTDRLYDLVARNRGRLGRLIGQQACAVDPSRRQARDSELNS